MPVTPYLWGLEVPFGSKAFGLTELKFLWFLCGSYCQIGLTNEDKEKLPHMMRWMDYIQVGPHPD